MGSAKSGGNEAERARRQEQQRQQDIRQGTRRINKIFDTRFDGGFYKGQRQDYLDYAKPQVEDQYGDAQKELTFSLTRSGLLDSSARADKAGDLQQLYDLNSQEVADDARSYASQAKSSVEDARSGLITTLNATGDAKGAANQAISRASALSAPAAYSPLTDLFSNFTAGLGTQAALEKANYYSDNRSPVRYQTGLFAPRNSVSVSQ